MHVSLIGIGIVAGMALIYDADSTIKLASTAITVRGMTWVVTKITKGISQDASQIIDFTGWSIAGVSIVKIIGNAMGSVGAIREFVSKVGVAFESVAGVVDKIVFWS